ncbi:MAG: ABC transporter ATP-binding protein [Nocardioidaceae bacterium]
MSELLEVRGLTVRFQAPGDRPDQVVNQLDFTAPRGKIVGLVGESGSGKSTAMWATLGLTKRYAKIVGGSVRLDGEELLGKSEKELGRIRGRDVALVTQTPRASLNPVVRVGDQVSAVYRNHTGASKAEARERVLELLSLVGINDPERRYAALPSELSGGMAQRVVITLALACGPKVLLADEPTSGLDVTVRAQILDDLTASVRRAGSTLVLVSQDLGVVANYCDEIYMMHAGQVVEHAEASTFFTDPEHPATLALLAAEHRRVDDSSRLRGQSVDTQRLPSGCLLHERCPFADVDAGCASSRPVLEAVGEGHEVRCHRASVVAGAWAGRKKEAVDA